MLTMLQTWQSGDVSQQEPYNGDFEAAMKGIKAKALVLPAKTDLYFREFLKPIPQTNPSNIPSKKRRKQNEDFGLMVC
jgi:homoserine acetyltransferase